MILSYLKIALRNILRYKAFSVINVAGLAVGMACCLMILLWVQDELSYDKFHQNTERIYRVGHELNLGGNYRKAPLTSPPMGKAIVDEYPEVENAVRLSQSPRKSVKYENNQFFEDEILFADNSIFEVFSFPLISGDKNNVLVDPFTVVLTRETAEKYFGQENPIGKVLHFGNGEDYTVTGILEDIPGNSHIYFDLLCSFETLYQRNPVEMEIWGYITYYTYILLAENSDAVALQSKLPDLIEKNLGDVLRRVGGSIELFLQPLTDIHLYSNLEGELRPGGDINYVYLFSGIAIFVLIIACANFINLSTAHSGRRAREVGIRKTFGAFKSGLIKQFYGETLVFSFLAMLLAILLLEVALPVFNKITERELVLNLTAQLWLIPGLLGFTALVGILAGSYPALFISSFQPVKVLKNSFSLSGNTRFRSVLVVIQFSISIALIIGTITVYNQLIFMKNKKLGFDKDHVVILPGAAPSEGQSFAAVKQEFLTISGITGISAAETAPGMSLRMMNFLPEGFSEDESQLMSLLSVDPDYISTLKMNIIEGRNFSHDLITDTLESVIINQTAATKFSWQNPLGKKITQTYHTPQGPVQLEKTVIGVIEDFHLQSLHAKIEPMFITYTPQDFGILALKVNGGNLTSTLNQIQDKWKEIYPDRAYDYSFLDETFDRQYKSEEKIGTVTLYFSLLAIFVGCLGLFGLSSFTAEQRTKEIGIRRILGASTGGIVKLLSREFVVLIIAANVIAIPISYYFLDKWLENFAYQTSLSWWIFLLAGMAALMIALSTISIQSVKAAMSDPAKSLKYE